MNVLWRPLSSTALRDRFAALPSTAGYAGVALLVGSELAGFPVPGETSLIAAAVLASQGHLSLPLVIALTAGAAIVGDTLGYVIGRRGGGWLLSRPGIGSKAGHACSSAAKRSSRVMGRRSSSWAAGSRG